MRYVFLPFNSGFLPCCFFNSLATFRDVAKTWVPANFTVLKRFYHQLKFQPSTNTCTVLEANFMLHSPKDPAGLIQIVMSQLRFFLATCTTLNII